MAGRRVLREPPLSNHTQPHQHLPSLHHREDRIAIQQSDIQSLLQDNQRLAATHVALKQELSLAQQELRHLSSTAASVKADRNADVREVYEKSLKLEAELRVIDSMHAELDRVRADVEKLSMIKLDMVKELNEINGELAKARAQMEDVVVIKAEIGTVRQEIKKGRAAIECEKKNRASNLEQREIMEKNIMSLSPHIEKLRAELLNAEREAAAAAPAAANPSTGYGNPDYRRSLFADPYSLHQVRGRAEHGHQPASGTAVFGPSEMHGPGAQS